MDPIPAPYRRSSLWMFLVFAAAAAAILFTDCIRLPLIPEHSASSAGMPSPEVSAPSPADTETICCNTASGAEDILNILLIGQDSHEGEAQSRSDSIILCTFHIPQQTLTMTSILRDLYVPIPGHRSNRINAAYASGGTLLLEQTLQENFNIAIDGSVVVDFTHFPKLIDLLGGVELPLRADEAEAINSSVPGMLTEGTCLLNGDQALTYVRIRKLDNEGDFGRTERQRKLLQALLMSYRTAEIPQLLQLIRESLSMVSTNMERKQIWRTARRLIPILSDLQITQQCIPAEGTYSYETIRGMCVLAADLDAARKLLENTIHPPTS